MLSLIEDSAVKGTGFNMNIASSDKGRIMIEQQMDSRRQRHIVALKESQKFIDQFYDTFCEKKNEIKEQCQQYTSQSDLEIKDLMSTLTDHNLQLNEITFVNGVWDKV
jgi:transcription termination factor NusB